MEQTSKLSLLPDDWQRALAVAAHPDDLEYGAASAIAGWTAAGKSVTYILLTSGEAGIDGMPPDKAKAVREAEQITAAAEVGVTSVEFLGFPGNATPVGPRTATVCSLRRPLLPGDPVLPHCLPGRSEHNGPPR